MPLGPGAGLLLAPVDLFCTVVSLDVSGAAGFCLLPLPCGMRVFGASQPTILVLSSWYGRRAEACVVGFRSSRLVRFQPWPLVLGMKPVATVEIVGFLNELDPWPCFGRELADEARLQRAA